MRTRDLARWPAMALANLVRLYQLVISPWRGPTCRYYPSCSAYAIGALKRFGLVRGLGLTVWRVLRCNPWSPGGVDHVPEVWELNSRRIEVSHELV